MKNLKALSAAALAVVLTLSLVACSSNEGATSESTSTATDSTVTEGATEETVGAAALGFGLVANAGSGDAKTNANTIVAAVLVDEAGVIVDAKLDVAQCYVMSEGGALTTPETYLTKKELGADYGMASISSLEEGEWYQQAAAFEAYIVGMNTADFANVAYDEETKVATDEDLLAGCTIKINEFVAAVQLAIDSATEFNCTVEDTLTLAMNTPAATPGEDGKLQLATTIAALVVNADGVVNDVCIDVTQPSFATTAEDAITGAGEVMSKQQKLDDYGMASFSSLEEGEWYQQAAAFEAHVVGMNTADFANIAYDSETRTALDEDLLAGCTIKINDYVDILVKAAG